MLVSLFTWSRDEWNPPAPSPLSPTAHLPTHCPANPSHPPYPSPSHSIPPYLPHFTNPVSVPILPCPCTHPAPITLLHCPIIIPPHPCLISTASSLPHPYPISNLPDTCPPHPIPVLSPHIPLPCSYPIPLLHTPTPWIEIKMPV